MDLWEEGIRGRVIEAIGGWQWGRGFLPPCLWGRPFAGITEGDGICRCGTVYFHSNDMFSEGGWVPASAGTRRGREGLSHIRGERWGGRFANRPYRGEGDRRGVGRWVPASARTRRGRDGLSHVRGEWEGAPPSPVFMGAGSRREDKVGEGDKISQLRCAVLGMICVR